MRAKETENNALAELMATEPENRAFEIVPGMTVEEMQFMFFDKAALIEPPYKVFQLNSKGHRYYYRFDGNGQPEFYPSVTTILSQTLPKSPFLVEWIASKGMDEAERYKAERAAYGTFMHAQFEELIINRVYNLDDLKEKLKTYVEVNRLPDDFIYYADDLKKDVLAFAQFVKDYDVRPLAVEIALVHPYYKYAGMVDLTCTMLRKPGGTERINAIVDFKSGRKGFHEEAEIQLHLYKMMWNVTFEEHPITNVFNFSPKDWRKKPSYNLKDQTDSPNAAKIPALLEIAAIEDDKRDNIFTSVSGSINLDEQQDFTDNVISLTLAELIKTKAPVEENPDETTDATVKVNAEPMKTASKKENKTAKVVKHTAKKTKTAEKGKNKPVKASKSSKGTTAPKKDEKPVNAKKETNDAQKKSLLADDLEI